MEKFRMTKFVFRAIGHGLIDSYLGLTLKLDHISLFLFLFPSVFFLFFLMAMVAGTLITYVFGHKMSHDHTASHRSYSWSEDWNSCLNTCLTRIRFDSLFLMKACGGI